MKKFIICFLMLFCLLPTQVLAQEIPVFNANGQKLPLTPSAYTENDVTMLPLRAIAEYLDAEVGWQANGTIYISKGDCQIALTVGQTNAAITSSNEQKTLSLSEPTLYKNNTLFVPMRFIAEAFDMPVNYCVNYQNDYKLPIIILGASKYADNYGYEDLIQNKNRNELFQQMQSEMTNTFYSPDEISTIYTYFVNTVMGIYAEAYNLNNLAESTLAYMDFFVSENIKQSNEWQQYLALANHQGSELSAVPLKISVTEDKISGSFGFEMFNVLYFIPLLVDVEITRFDGVLAEEAPECYWSYIEKDDNGHSWIVTQISNPRAYINLQALRDNEPEMYERWTQRDNIFNWFNSQEEEN